jgi:hypothetical protein
LVNARFLPRRLFQLQFFAAMLVTMTLCGLWHGAAWTFILWGALHGCALVVCALWRRYCPRLPWLVGWAMTVLFVLLTGVIFRAGSLDAAWHVYAGLGIPPDLHRSSDLIPLLASPLIAFLLPASQDIVEMAVRRPRPALAGLLGIGVLLLLIDLGGRDPYEFVYFKF